MHQLNKRVLVGQVLLAISLLAAACGGPSTQPPPPAEAADPDLIMKPDTPECETRCTSLGENYEKCAASLCAAGEYPLLGLSSIDSWEKSPGDTVELTGGFGVQEENLSVALAEERDGRLYHRYRLAVLSWENNHIVAVIHEEVNIGQYQILLVYELNFGESARPVFMQGSETLPINVRNP